MGAIRNLLAPETIPLGAKITRNVAFTAARSIILAPLPFVLIPYYLKKLGPAGYGTWAVFLAVNGMTSLADFGLVTSISKHVAQHYALKDFRALGQLISTGLALYFGIACATAGVLWAGAQIIVPALFRNSPVAPSMLSMLWRFLILLVFANILSLLLSSIVVGLQRMDLSTGMNALNLGLSAGLSVSFLRMGLGLRGLIYGYLIAAWLVTSFYAYLVRRLLPEVHLRLAFCRWQVAHEILSFSVKTYVTQVAVAIHNQIEKFYLAHFVGVISVGWYDISSDLALKLRTIPSLVLAPIMPAASELDARNDGGRMMHLYFRAHKYLAFIGIPVVVYTALVAKSFVTLWVGPAYSFIAVPLSILLAVNFINLVTGPGYLILIGMGNLRPGLRSAIFGIALNLTLSLFLIRRYGFRGAVIGTSVSLCMASAFFLVEYQLQTKTSLLDLVRKAYLKPLFSSLLIVAVLWFFGRSMDTRWIVLVAGALLFGLLYVVLLLLFRFFDGEDLSILERVIRLPSFFRRIVPHAELGRPVLSDRESAQAISEHD
jgi:O-antigen/teichoic acid export membrane protein